MSVNWRKDREPVDELERAMLDDDIINPDPPAWTQEGDWSTEYLREDWIDTYPIVIALLICAVAGIGVAVACGFTVSAVFGFKLQDVFGGVLGLFR